MATKTVVKKLPYNVKAYVPGGSSTKVAKAIVAAGFNPPPGAKTILAPKLVKEVVRTATPQNSFTTIETPAQIEERVTRMAKEAYDRQKADLDATAAQLRQQALGRQQALQAAYAAAAKLNQGFADDVQTGWSTAANTLSGLSGAVTGSVGDALRADLATQEQALARVGAGGTGFDATSQQGVEQYRGGTIPAESMNRMGAIGREAVDAQAISLANRGLQEGEANYNIDKNKINSDLMQQVRELSAGRTKMESDLREQLLGARGDQIKAIQDEREFKANLALKKVQIEQAQQKINNDFKKALASARTAADRAEVYRWKAEQDQILSAARNGIAQQNADANTTRANTAVTKLTTPAPAKPPSGTAVSNNLKRAKVDGAAAFNTEMKRISAMVPGMNPPADWDEDKKGKYFDSAAYAAAYAKAKKLASAQFFGSLMYRVIESMNDHLSPVGYTKDQIKRAAYELVSAKIPAPAAWRAANPGYGPKVASGIKT